MTTHVVLTVGDPAGIGPELASVALRDREVAASMRLTVVGPEACRPEGDLGPHRWHATEGPARWTMGEPQQSCGRAALTALRAGVDLVEGGGGDALVCGPVCKEALHLAGEEVEGQTELLLRWAGVEDSAQMVGVAGQLRVMLLTRHLPLREALDRVRPAAIVERLTLFDRALRGIGIEAPRLAVAGFNPHAGEGGVLGSEDGDLVVPGVEAARRAGLDVSGPRSADTVFLEGTRGRWDGILALYHDQAFVPLKLHQPGQGLTWIAGLPYLRLSPVHGTAFDIAGKGEADPTNLLHTLHTAAAWVR